MAWLEPFVQDFLSEVQATLAVVEACSGGVDVAKQWLFASSFASLQQLAATCSHQGQHTSVIGTRDEQGNFLSQRTAEYPTALATRYSKLVTPRFDGYRLHEQSDFCSLSFALQCGSAKAALPPLSGLRMAVASIPPPTGLTGQDTSPIYFVTCARNGNSGFWRSTSPQGSPNMLRSIASLLSSLRMEQLGYSNHLCVFLTNTRSPRTGTSLCLRHNHTACPLCRDLATWLQIKTPRFSHH